MTKIADRWKVIAYRNDYDRNKKKKKKKKKQEKTVLKEWKHRFDYGGGDEVTVGGGW